MSISDPPNAGRPHFSQVTGLPPPYTALKITPAPSRNHIDDETVQGAKSDAYEPPDVAREAFRVICDEILDCSLVPLHRNALENPAFHVILEYVIARLTRIKASDMSDFATEQQ